MSTCIYEYDFSWSDHYDKHSLSEDLSRAAIAAATVEEGGKVIISVIGAELEIDFKEKSVYVIV